MDYSGQRFEHYQLTEILGQGGMATVYKAYDTRLDRDVAIKVVRKESIPPEQLERILKRFEREAKAMAKFSHPNIVPIYDYGEEDGSPYLVMEYMPEGTLEDKTGQPVPVDTALSWLAPIADALAYAHDFNVVHRDVKPSNILFDQKGRPILTDFGIAKALETEETTLTRTGLGVGTAGYMAPEQWRGKACLETDQYALGVVLFELLTGQKPYTADTTAELVILQATEALPQPSKLVEGIPEDVEKVLYKVLTLDPRNRYEDMEAFAIVLRDLLAISDTVEYILPPSEPRKQEPKTEPETPPSNESITQDTLDGTPVEEVIPALKNKRGLPKWARLGAIGIIGLVIIGLAIGIGGNLVDMGKGGEGPLAMLATETPIIAPTVEKTLVVGSTMMNEKDGAEMVYVPAGQFLMGSEDEGAYNDEDPEHTVYLDAYWMYMREVTNQQYAAFLTEKKNQKEEGVTWLNASDGDTNVHQDETGWSADIRYEDHPVVEVTWYGAQAYCEWAGGELPTEAQWEKAARGNEGGTYPWGDESPNSSLANFNDNLGEALPVWSYSEGASIYGALNMLGNVWEWVADWYDEDYYQNSPSQNPTGPANGNYRVLRGGSWINSGRLLRASYRYKNLPSKSHHTIGFRCVTSEEPQE